MDPLSACATAIGAVAQAIDIGMMVYGIIDGIKSLPETIRRLGVELRGLYQVLKLLLQSLERQKSKEQQDGFQIDMVNGIKELVDNCIDVFYDIKKIIRPYMDSDGSAVRSWRKGLKWEVVKKDNVDTLQKALSNSKASLTIAISTLNMFQSSQTNEMVAHLQRDVRRLGRQIKQNGQGGQRELARADDTHKQHGTSLQDPYSIPMQRFLARTATVASRMSTSTGTTDPDTFLSDDLTAVADVTAYRELGSPEPILGLNAEYYQDAEKACSFPTQIETRPVGPFLNPVGGSQGLETSRTFPQSKQSAWKKLRNRMKGSKSGDTLLPVPGLEIQAASEYVVEQYPASEGAKPSHPESESLPLGEDDRVMTQSPTSAHFDNPIHREASPHPEGTQLTKSKSTPLVTLHDATLERPSASLAYRSMSTPGTNFVTIPTFDVSRDASMIPHGGIMSTPRRAGDATLLDSGTQGQRVNDRDALLSSSRRLLSSEPAHEAYPTTDPDTPCRACKSTIQQAKHYKLQKDVWHTQCFRCSSCNVLLHADSPAPFLLKDDFLVCNSCSYNCQKCDERIEEHGAKDEYSGKFSRMQALAPTAEQLDCPGLCFCHECYKSIKNLRYVRTTQGIFCWGCHNPTMSSVERRRKEKEMEKSRPGPILVK